MSSAQEEFIELMRDKGKRIAHPEDDGLDGQSFLNISDSEDENTPPAVAEDAEEGFSTRVVNQARTMIPLTRYEANTGPKGVISDAQNFRDSRRLHRVSMRGFNNISSKPLGRLEQEVLSDEKIEEADADDEEEEDVEDHDFMQQWRTSRLKELQSGARDNSKVYNRHRKSRVWGGLTTVDGNGYLNAVDNSPRDTVVVVLIYDDEVGRPVAQ